MELSLERFLVRKGAKKYPEGGSLNGQMKGINIYSTKLPINKLLIV